MQERFHPLSTVQKKKKLLLCKGTYGDFVIWSLYENCYIERIQIDLEYAILLMFKEKLSFYEVVLP